MAFAFSSLSSLFISGFHPLQLCWSCSGNAPAPCQGSASWVSLRTSGLVQSGLEPCSHRPSSQQTGLWGSLGLRVPVSCGKNRPAAGGDRLGLVSFSGADLECEYSWKCCFIYTPDIRGSKKVMKNTVIKTMLNLASGCVNVRIFFWPYRCPFLY